MKFFSIKKCALVFLITVLPFAVNAAAANESDSAASSPEIFRVKGKSSYSQIRNLKDDQKVELSSGRVVSAGRMKDLADFIRAASKVKKPAATGMTSFSRPTTGNIKIEKGFNLRSIDKLKPNETMRLPSGRMITASDFKKLDQLNKTINGRSLLDNQPQLPNRSGPAIKISSPKDLDALKDKPDSTVLENPAGKRITLGELRAYAKKQNKPFGVR
jgi:hypothetical protein